MRSSPVLSGPQQALLGVLLIVLMMGLGSTLTIANFREILRRPKGPLIGLASQFGWMPLVAFGLAVALDLPDAMALSLIVVGCTPGGTTSNLFTYYARADVALSVSMTAISSVTALVMMPLTLSLYSRSFTDADFAVPTRSIVLTLAVMLVPMAIGMLVRARSPAAARKIERIGGLSGVGVLLLLIVSGLVSNGHLLLESSASIYVAGIGLGLVGIILGYLSAALFRLPEASRRAVAFETGIQNSPLALGIIIATFPAERHAEMMWIPLLYALFVIATASLITLVLRRRASAT